MINKLSKDTIDKIAAGEVVERPMSIVKEFVENSIDAGADAVTVEIRNGGIDLIRVTDNGSGIPCEDVRTAFEAHATSKITDASDLDTIASLGFRGEALSSIAAVSRVELITKTQDAVTAVRYQKEGGTELGYSEVGAPDGTTIIARDIFYNVPARRKFLKSAATEGAHITEMLEKMALSHPDIAFRMILGNQTRLQTSGSGDLRDCIFRIYGKEIAGAVVPLVYEADGVRIRGYLGKPEISRSSRNYESVFVNGRYIRSGLISKAIEEGYGTRLMQHQYPLAVLLLEIDPGMMDVNVHPTKMEVRFSRQNLIYDSVLQAVRDAFAERVLIPHAILDADSEKDTSGSGRQRPAEPFETGRQRMSKQMMPQEGDMSGNALTEDIMVQQQPGEPQSSLPDCRIMQSPLPGSREVQTLSPDCRGMRSVPLHEQNPEPTESAHYPAENAVQASFLEGQAEEPVRIVGQIFDTYWILEKNNKIYLMDQHAAHEKVTFEKLMHQYESTEVSSQMLNPPFILTLSAVEGNLLQENLLSMKKAGFEIEPFGGREFAVRAVPAYLPTVPKDELLKEMIAGLREDGIRTPEPSQIIARIASLSCKAAIKGGQTISRQEAELLIRELMACENPYSCPHGRPTMIEFTKKDLEKKFKRVL